VPGVEQPVGPDRRPVEVAGAQDVLHDPQVGVAGLAYRPGDQRLGDTVDHEPAIGVLVRLDGCRADHDHSPHSRTAHRRHNAGHRLAVEGDRPPRERNAQRRQHRAGSLHRLGHPVVVAGIGLGDDQPRVADREPGRMTGHRDNLMTRFEGLADEQAPGLAVGPEYR
jgi:hypothetical protein